MIDSPDGALDALGAGVVGPLLLGLALILALAAAMRLVARSLGQPGVLGEVVAG